MTVARGTPSFKLNPEKPNYVPRENLIVLAKTDGSYVEVESYAEGNSLHCNVNADTVYLIADGYEWYGAFGEGEGFTPHDTAFHSVEYGFEITISQIPYNTIIDYLRESEGMKYKQVLTTDTTAYNYSPDFTVESLYCEYEGSFVQYLLDLMGT